MAQKYINNWSTTLTQSLAPSEIIIRTSLDEANRLAAILSQGDYCILTLDDNGQIEIIKAIAVSGSDILIERAQEGTIANTRLAGSKIEARITAGTLSEIQSQGSSPLNPVITEFFEGPGELSINAAEYRLYFGGPGLKTVHLPINLATNQRHSVLIHGQNTNGSSVSVQIGDNNVHWDSGSPPTFPSSGSLIEAMLFTLDGGNQWYGRVLGTY